MLQDPVSGHWYYANSKTKETRWTLPSYFKPIVPKQILVENKANNDA